MTSYLSSLVPDQPVRDQSTVVILDGFWSWLLLLENIVWGT